MTTNLLKNRLFLAFVAAMVVLVIVATVFRFLTPPAALPITPPTITQQSVDGSRTNFREVTFTGEAPTLPEEVGVYTVAENTLTAQNLATLFSLTLHPKIPNYWKNDQYSLEHDSTENRYVLADLSVDQSLTLTSLDSQTAIPLARSFVETYFSGFNLTPLEDKLLYFSSEGGHYYESSPLEATIIEVPFAPLVENTPVYYQAEKDYPVVATTIADRVIKLEFTPAQLSFNQANRHQLILIEDALFNINDRNLGAIISAFRNGVGVLDLKNIARGEMTDVQLEYRWDEQLRLLIPFYRFQGRVTNSADETWNVDLITPAIETAN